MTLALASTERSVTRKAKRSRICWSSATERSQVGHFPSGFGPTKTSKVRWIDIPRQLCEVMTAHLEQRGAPDPEALVWVGERGGPLNHKWWYKQRFKPVVLRCKELGRAMRIGTNHGSLSDRIMNRYGDTPLGTVESAPG